MIRGPRKWFLGKPEWGLAAAAVFVVAVFGLFNLLRSPGPPLPAPAGETVLRGGRIEAIGPIGELERMPESLRWKGFPGAQSYRVQMFEVDDTVLWQYTGTESTQDLPRDVLDRMHPAVVYGWEVEALDADGTKIARSDRVEFRVRPGVR